MPPITGSSRRARCRWSRRRARRARRRRAALRPSGCSIRADDSRRLGRRSRSTPSAPDRRRRRMRSAATPLAPPVSSAPLRRSVVAASRSVAARAAAFPESSTRPMPASEQQISVAAHRPPSSRSDHTRVLPSVIVDVASEYVGLVERVARRRRSRRRGTDAPTTPRPSSFARAATRCPRSWRASRAR